MSRLSGLSLISLVLLWMTAQAHAASTLEQKAVAIANEIETLYRANDATPNKAVAQRSARQIALDALHTLQKAATVLPEPEIAPPPPNSIPMLKLISAGTALSAILAYNHNHTQMALILAPTAIASYFLARKLAKPPTPKPNAPIIDHAQVARGAKIFMGWITAELRRRGIPVVVENDGICQAYLDAVAFVRIVDLERIQFFENLNGRR